MDLVLLVQQVISSRGPAAGALVSVKTPDGGFADVYDENGIRGANPLVTDAEGWFRCWVTPGRYDIVITAPGAVEVTEYMTAERLRPAEGDE